MIELRTALKDYLTIRHCSRHTDPNGPGTGDRGRLAQPATWGAVRNLADALNHGLTNH